MRQSLTVFAAIVAASLIATPIAIGASNAFAAPETSDAVEMPAAVTKIDVVAMPAPVAVQTCTHKVRVVYAGYGTPSETCKR